MVRIPGGPPGEKDSCYCQPIRAAQSPQECLLQTTIPLPWTPLQGSRQRPSPSPRHRRNASIQSNRGLSDYTLDKSLPHLQQGGGAPLHGHYFNNDRQLEGKWEHPGYKLMQNLPEPSVPQQPPAVTYPQYTSNQDFNAYPLQCRSILQHPIPSDPIVTQQHSGHIHTPAQTPSSPKKGACCGSSSKENQIDPSAQWNDSRQSTDEKYSSQKHHLGMESELQSDWGFQAANSEMIADPFHSAPSLSNEGVSSEVPYNYFDHQDPSIVQQPFPIPDNGCQCGPSCNCVYCTKHPTNEATRGRIGELYTIMDQQQPFDESAEPSGNRPTSSYNSSAQMPTATFDSNPGGFPDQQQFHTNDYSFGEPHFNHDLNHADYFEMTFPVGGCANGYCRCGDNCACVGCLTHTGHVPLPMQ